MSTTTADNVGSMEDEAFKRKERLKAMKRSATESSATNNGNEEDNKSDKKPKFRSYEPQDKSTIESIETAKALTTDIEAEVQSQLDLLKTPIVIDEIDITNLAPRKPDWDLKRDVSKKLEKLERRTQRAIAELIRDRLKKNQENMLLQAVNVAAAITTDSLDLEETND